MSEAPKPETSASPISSNKPSPEELLARAKAMAPALAARAQECEKLGRLPDETNQAFWDAGFYRICQPAIYGGYEYHPPVMYRVVMEVAKACPSSAWVLAVLCIHQWLIGLCEPRVTEEILGEDTTTQFSTSVNPTGTAKKVDGGYILNGRWSWATGVDFASWMLPGAIAENDQGEMELITFFVPESDYEIDHESWDTNGMSGTGSKTVVIKDAFVPDYRRYFLSKAVAMEDPGREKFTADAYKLPFAVAFSFCISAVAVGAAEGALEYCTNYLRERKSAYDGAAFQGMITTQIRMGEMKSVVDDLRLKMETDFAEMEHYTREEGGLPMDVRLRQRWHTSEIPRIAKNAINLLVEGCGGSPFADDNPLQRYFRDINCIVNHRIVNYDEGAAAYGHYLLTGETNALLY